MKLLHKLGLFLPHRKLKRRLEVYEKMIPLLANKWNDGFCGSIHSVTGINYTGKMHLFPELYVHKPPTASKRSYWWGINEGREIRISILKKIIKSNS